MTDNVTRVWESLSWDQIIVYVGLLSVFVGLIVFLWWVVRGTSEIEWWQFIATKELDGKNHGDIDKLGKLVALVVSSVIIVWHGYALKIDALLLGIYLTYAGAIGGWAAYLRYKQRNGSQPPAAPVNGGTDAKA